MKASVIKNESVEHSTQGQGKQFLIFKDYCFP